MLSTLSGKNYERKGKIGFFPVVENDFCLEKNVRITQGANVSGYFSGKVAFPKMHHIGALIYKDFYVYIYRSKIIYTPVYRKAKSSWTFDQFPLPPTCKPLKGYIPPISAHFVYTLSLNNQRTYP